MEQLKKLETGKTYTMVRTGGMGFVFSVTFVLQEIRVERYAQYPESVVLVVKPKGKRKLAGYRFVPRDTYAVWAGEVQANTEMYVESETRDGFTIKKSLGSCDPEYMRRAIKSVNQAPVALNFEEEAAA